LRVWIRELDIIETIHRQEETCITAVCRMNQTGMSLSGICSIRDARVDIDSLCRGSMITKYRMILILNRGFDWRLLRCDDRDADQYYLLKQRLALLSACASCFSLACWHPTPFQRQGQPRLRGVGAVQGSGEGYGQ
jgi:hypothetical protein